MINSAFYNLEPKKRQRILDTAAKIIAKQGFHKANVNEIAAAAGISVGALYTYFDAKEDIFEAVFMEAVQVTAEVQRKVVAQNESLRDQLLNLFVEGLMMARRRPSYVEIYLNMMAPGMETFADKFSPELETAGAIIYEALLKKGIHTGELRTDLDIRAVAYVLDNTMLALYGSIPNRFFSIHRSVLLQESPGRLTRVWAEGVARRVLLPLWEGIRAPENKLPNNT